MNPQTYIVDQLNPTDPIPNPPHAPKPLTNQQAIALDGLYYQEMEINQCDAKVNKLSDWTLPRFRQLIERCVPVPCVAF